jgi:hypothetical protein
MELTWQNLLIISVLLATAFGLGHLKQKQYL